MVIKASIVESACKMRSGGYSYLEISERLGISKSAVYNFTKDIKLEETAKERILVKIRNNQMKFINKYAKSKKLIRATQWNINKARIISHCIFDGSVTRAVVNYTSSSKRLLDEFIDDMYNVYDMKFTNIYVKQGKFLKKYTVSYCSINLCKDLFKYSPSYNSISDLTRIPNKVFLSNNEIKVEFLRCFWEDEGCITIDGEILARIKNRHVRDQLVQLHKSLSVECSSYDCSDGAFGIRINRNKENLDRFKDISFKHSVVVRGINKGVLKRDLLEKALKKYEYGPVV